MANPVEAGLDIAFEYPFRAVASGQCYEALLDGVRCRQEQSFGRLMQTVNNARIPYGWLMNSNAFAHQAAEVLGLTTPVPRVFGPGWNTQLPV
jgi:hypothetical protein